MLSRRRPRDVLVLSRSANWRCLQAAIPKFLCSSLSSTNSKSTSSSINSSTRQLQKWVHSIIGILQNQEPRRETEELVIRHGTEEPREPHTELGEPSYYQDGHGKIFGECLVLDNVPPPMQQTPIQIQHATQDY